MNSKAAIRAKATALLHSATLRFSISSLLFGVHLRPALLSYMPALATNPKPKPEGLWFRGELRFGICVWVALAVRVPRLAVSRNLLGGCVRDARLTYLAHNRCTYKTALGSPGRRKSARASSAFLSAVVATVAHEVQERCSFALR